MLKKELSDSDLGRASSHQTHIGLHEDMLRGWTEADRKYGCYLFIESLDCCIECEAVINAITSESGSIRSPKIKTGTDIPDEKNLLKLIRNYATNERRYLTLGQLPDDKLLAFLSTNESDIADEERKRFTIPDDETDSIEEIITPLHRAVHDCAGIAVKKTLLGRVVASLLAKRFLILTGLSGSGKTKLAQAFANWICEDQKDMELIPVGADWTSRENVLGYMDTINDTYHKEAPLELILRAKANRDDDRQPTRPFFLILDEMNLSHVERYFADFLSAIESERAIPMHIGDEAAYGVPQRLDLPENLFVIGTVNIDETTYLFSPKVLDRANTVEFRVDPADFDAFMDEAIPISFEGLQGRGRRRGPSFVKEANKVAPLKSVRGFQHEDFKRDMGVLLRLFGAMCWEFGYRTGQEISRFVYFHKLLTGSDWEFEDALDAQIVQKLMPKLNGSEDKLRGILCALAWYSSGFVKLTEKAADEDDGAYYHKLAVIFIHLAGKRSPENLAKALNEQSNPLSTANAETEFEGIEVEAADSCPDSPKMPLTFDKTLRMWRAVKQNGFTSYAEN